ncbi:MAG: SH3 domain-containing protein [Caldilineaceae bacterium]|nr:SH3 domain-containing protein [Caldilineaceae bacterium]
MFKKYAFGIIIAILCVMIPLSAMAQERITFTVEVGFGRDIELSFDLFPNGDITNATINRSGATVEISRRSLSTGVTLDSDEATPTPTETASFATNKPTVTPKSTISAEGVVNRDANLRGGPGTNYGVTGSVKSGQKVIIVFKNGDWYKLSTGDWVAAFLIDIEDEANVIPEITPASTVTPAPTRSPEQEFGGLIDFIERKLKSNREGVGDPVVDVILYLGDNGASGTYNIRIDYALNDGWDGPSIIRGAAYDISSILEFAQKNYAGRYNDIMFFGTMSLVDTLGNTSEDIVLKAVYKRDLIDAINFDGFIATNVFDITDNKYIHPVMTK